MYRYFLALRYLLSRPINLLGMIGVTLGVWSLILVVSIFSGFLKVFRAHVQSALGNVLNLQSQYGSWDHAERLLEELRTNNALAGELYPHQCDGDWRPDKCLTSTG